MRSNKCNSTRTHLVRSLINHNESKTKYKRLKLEIHTSVFLIYCFRWRPYNTANAFRYAMALCIDDRAHCSSLMIFLLASSCWYLKTTKCRDKNKNKIIMGHIILAPFTQKNEVFLDIDWQIDSLIKSIIISEI